MSQVKLQGNAGGSGSVTIASPNTNSNYVATLPEGTGTIAVQGVSSNIVSGTAVASTSGTSIDFTSIPSWVKRITVMFNNVSTNGSSIVQLQIGAGSIQTSSYNGNTGSFTNAASPNTTTFSTGFATSAGGSAGDFRNGNFTLTYVGSNIWTCTGQFAIATYFTFGTGQVSLSGTLDRVRITTVNGTDTFDAGSINILYE